MKIKLTGFHTLAVLSLAALGACSHSDMVIQTQDIKLHTRGTDKAYCHVQAGSNSYTVTAPRIFRVVKSPEDMILACSHQKRRVNLRVPAMVHEKPVWRGHAAEGVRMKSHYRYPSEITIDFSIFESAPDMPGAPSVMPEPVKMQSVDSPTSLEGDEAASSSISAEPAGAKMQGDEKKDHLMNVLEKLGSESENDSADDDVVEIEGGNGPVSLYPDQ